MKKIKFLIIMFFIMNIFCLLSSCGLNTSKDVSDRLIINYTYLLNESSNYDFSNIKESNSDIYYYKKGYVYLKELSAYKGKINDFDNETYYMDESQITELIVNSLGLNNSTISFDEFAIVYANEDGNKRNIIIPMPYELSKESIDNYARFDEKKGNIIDIYIFIKIQ